MDYEKQVEFSGDPKKAIEVAQTMLLQSGYQITDFSDTRISAEHKGGFLRTQSGNVIYGASPISVGIKDTRLSISAGYGGIKKAKKFILHVLLGLALLLGLVFGILFTALFDDKMPAVLAVGLGIGIPLIQLPIHLLVTPRIMKKRADKALDTLIHNITMIAR
jgi:hypothetical protein